MAIVVSYHLGNRLVIVTSVITVTNHCYRYFLPVVGLRTPVEPLLLSPSPVTGAARNVVVLGRARGRFRLVLATMLARTSTTGHFESCACIKLWAPHSPHTPFKIITIIPIIL